MFLRWVLVAATPLVYKLYKEYKTPKPKGVTIGHYVGSLGGRTVIGLPHGRPLQHIHILGATGSGKTTMLANLAVHDMLSGKGFAVVDPKGDLVDTILRHVPDNRIDDVIVFDPADRERPLGFNILEYVPPEERTRSAGEIVSVFKKMFESSSWGPRLEHILRQVALTLLEIPGSTLVDVRDILANSDYRRGLLEQVKSPDLLEFWEDEFAQYSAAMALTVAAPIYNKVTTWLAYAEIKNVLVQPTSSFNIRDVMDKKKILLVRLPHSQLGEDASQFLGALIVSRIQLAAMSRQSGSNLPVFFLYVDEFQNFVTSTFEKTVAEVRSYGLGLIVANQVASQLRRGLEKALDGNIAVRLQCYKHGGKHLAEYKLLQDINQKGLTIELLPPLSGGNTVAARKILALSRIRYGRVRAEIETSNALRRQGRRPQANRNRGLQSSGPTIQLTGGDIFMDQSDGITGE